MKLFVILFCMVTGCASNSQRIKDGENDLKSNNNTRKAASLVVDEIIREDQHYRSKDVTAYDQSADTSSNESKASEKPPSAVAPITEVHKSRQRVYRGRRTDLWSLLKYSHQRISANNFLQRLNEPMEVKRSFPTAAIIRDTGRDFASNTARSSRTKRDASVWHVPPGFRYEFNHYFPQRLKDQVEVALKAEQKVIESLNATGWVPFVIKEEYIKEKTLERQIAREEYQAGGKAKMHGYLTLVWDWWGASQYLEDIFQLIPKNIYFFDHKGFGYIWYEAMKDKEADTIEAFIRGTGPDIYEGKKGKRLFDPRDPASFEKYNIECPKKKRDAESVATTVHAQVFVIFLCVVFGVFIVNLQRLDVDEDDRKINKISGKGKGSCPRKGRTAPAEI